MQGRTLIVTGTVLLLAFPGKPQGQPPGPNPPLSKGKIHKVGLPQKVGQTTHTSAKQGDEIDWHKKSGETDHFLIQFETASPCTQGMTIQEQPTGGIAVCNINPSAVPGSYLYDVQKVDHPTTFSVTPCKGCGALDITASARPSAKPTN